jgi:hypothetical protein
MPTKAAPIVYNLSNIMTPSELQSIINGDSVTVDGITYQYDNVQGRVVASNEA